jgi:hypothetical protein
MKEIPILFSTPMVQALLSGTKTMTRRIVKMYATSDAHPMRQNATWLQENKTCPYGKVGDILWVREGFYKLTSEKLNGNFFYKADLATQGWNFKWKPSIHMPKEACRLFLKVKAVRVERLQDIPRQDCINEGIAYKEENWEKLRGLPGSYFDYGRKTFCPLPSGKISPSMSFKSLWNSINGPDSWSANPWVWVIEFERIAKP